MGYPGAPAPDLTRPREMHTIAKAMNRSSTDQIAEPIFGQLSSIAKSAAQSAYSPYSNFPVGAAVLADNGQIYSGCNVENASFGLTICAERNAIFHAIAQGAKRIRAVVVYTPTPTPSASCGSCRQVIAELGPEAHVYCVCDGPAILHLDSTTLLPYAFGPVDIKLHVNEDSS